MKDLWSLFKRDSLRNISEKDQLHQQTLPGTGVIEEVEKEPSFEHQAFLTMDRIYTKMENEDDPSKAILLTLREIMEFYHADWAGIVYLDLPIQVWTPYMWISERTGEMGWTRIQKYEYSETFMRWVQCFNDRKPLIMCDREKIKETAPDEYENYLRLNAHAVMAYPFDKKQKGFLLVRNQKMYMDRADLLKHCVPVIVAAMNERALLERTRELSRPSLFDQDYSMEDQEVKTADMIVGMFGEPWVKMVGGAISFSQNRSPIAWRLFTRLMLSRGTIASKEKMMEAIDRDDKVTNPERNLRDHIYNLRSFFRMITDEDIIENVRGKGYQINPSFSIITDYEVFDRYLEHAKKATTNFSRIQCLETAVKLYKGRFFENEYDDPSIVDQARSYDVKYLQALIDLLRSLFEAGDYDKVQKYAGTGLKYDPGNAAFYYWMILALKRNNQEKEAESFRIMAEDNLDEEGLKELQIGLKIQIR